MQIPNEALDLIIHKANVVGINFMALCCVQLL